MKLDVKNLPEDPIQLKQIIVNLDQRLSYLLDQVRLLQNQIYGKKSEKRFQPDDKQICLFNEAQVDNQPQAEDVTEVIDVASHSRVKRGRKPLPADLPRVEIIHDLPAEQKMCACGCQPKRIGQEVCDKLDYIPAKVQVERHIRYKYACPACEGVADDGATVKIAPAPVQLIPKSMATAGLLAQIVTAKFEDALPLYRQEKIFGRLGIDLGRATMCGWMVKVAQRAGPLLELLCQMIRCGPIIAIDETVVQVLNEQGRANTTKSYMWVFRGGDPDKPVLILRYHPTRSGQVPLDFLKQYQGYVQTDGYVGYDVVGKQPGIVLVGCWAHVRRKFIAVIKAQTGAGKHSRAEHAVKTIGKLYAIEKQAGDENLSPEQIMDLRQQKAKPILDEFKTWLDQNVVITPPKGLLGQAINYTLNQWTRLVVYLEDGRLRPDNNLTENAIRPFVVGRKNWLFAGDPSGADASAALYSLIETAKANGHKAYFYLRYLFDRLPLAHSESDYAALLPQNLEPAVVQAAVR